MPARISRFQLVVVDPISTRNRDVVSVRLAAGEPVALTPHQARRLAEQLHAAADDLEPIAHPRTARPAFGWRRVRRVVPDLAELETVDRIVTERVENGHGLRAIARILRAEGITTRDGGQWAAGTVARVLDRDPRTRTPHAAASNRGEAAVSA